MEQVASSHPFEKFFASGKLNFEAVRVLVISRRIFREDEIAAHLRLEKFAVLRWREKLVQSPLTTTMTFPATQTSCLFYCRSAPKIELNPSFRSAIREPRKPRFSLKSGDPLTFSDLEGDLTPSDFEFNFQPRFAKTYANHFSISAKDRRGAPCCYLELGRHVDLKSETLFSFPK